MIGCTQRSEWTQSVASNTYLKGALSKQLYPLLQSPSCFKLKLEPRWFMMQLQHVVSEENFRELHAMRLKGHGVTAGGRIREMIPVEKVDSVLVP